MVEEIIDETSRSLESGADGQEPATPGTEANTDGSSASDGDATIPWDDDPRWKEWRAKEKKVSEIMETHGYDDLDTMLDAAATSKKLQDELGVEDIRSLVEAGQAAQDKLYKIESYWAEQDMKKKKDEDPDAYVELLEKKVKDAETSSKEEAELRRKQDSFDKDMSFYNRSVESYIENKDNVTAKEKEFLKVILAYDSFLSDTKIDSKSSIKDTLNKLDSMMSDLRQSIIESYRDGKIEMPKISSTEATPTTIKEKTPSSFADAKKQMLELLRKNRGV